MRKLLLVFLVLASTSVWAQNSSGWRQDSGWFIGAVIGAGELDETIVENGDEVRDNSDDQDTTAGIVGGYQFNRFVGIEAGYHVFGEMTANDGVNRVDLDVQGIKITGYGRLPIGQRFALVGKLGAFHSYVKESVHFENFTRDDDEWDVSVAVEVGAHFKFTPNLTGSVEIGYYNLNLLDFDWDNYDDYDDFDDWWDQVDGLDRSITSAQVGLRYRF